MTGATRGAAFTASVPPKTNATALLQRGITAINHEGAMEETRRKLVWVESENFQGWACSVCAWAFNPLGPPVGQSLGEMMIQYERQRDKEFASHVCAERPRASKNLR